MTLDGVTARQLELGRLIIRAVKVRGLSKRAAYVAVTTSMAENGYGKWGLAVWANDGNSTLKDAYLGRQLNDRERATARESMKYMAPGDPVGRNLDSMGLYQQRPMSGWGTPRELMDPEISAGKFLDGAGGNRGLTDIPGWEQMEVYAAGQKVQGSLPKDAWLYQAWQPKGIQFVDELWDSVVVGETSQSDDWLEDLMREGDPTWA